MAESFPELTSFGTLFGFALALEDRVADLASGAAKDEAAADRRDQLLGCASTHAKRHRQLERLRRERLNEVVLQAISGMDGADYLPAADARDLAAVVAAEEATARFYDDAALIAANVLSGMDRKFRKLAAESRELARKLGG
jgi:hypothetical protein